MSNTVFSIRVSNDMRDAINASARKNGMSVNDFISDSVLSYLGFSQWPASHYSLHPASACVVCGNPLPEGKARYCSDECKKKARAAQAREARRKRLSQSQSPED